MTGFLGSVLTKRYTNPSSDIITVVAGLDDADVVFSDFVSAVDVTVRSGRSIQIRQKAVKAALAMTSGAYATGLVSYFTHRDLFPALMKFAHDSENSKQILEPFVLLGLLVNYNKFEFQNPYRLRLGDFVNDATIQKIVRCVGVTCTAARDKYIAIQEDLPESWSLGGTLSWVGLGRLAQTSRETTPTLTVEETAASFAALPGPEATLLLSTYDFTNANKLFCHNLITMPADEKGESPPVSAFLSFTSYLTQHAHRSDRSAHYTYINLYIIQILVEDPALAKRICSDDSKVAVRLCRQRQPFLPVVRGDRPLVATILDIMVDGINHNLRRRLDIHFFMYEICSANFFARLLLTSSQGNVCGSCCGQYRFSGGTELEFTFTGLSCGGHYFPSSAFSRNLSRM